ncbi:MAG: DNA-processing protein DprA [Deferrisomatales bacterium]
MDGDAVVDALVLRGARGVGDRGFRLLVDAFGSAGAALGAGADALAERCGGSPALAEALRAAAAARPEARREEERARALGFRLACYGGAGYPRLLAEIADPPPVLYLTGELPTAPAVAVVGSRRASTHGVRFARRLAQDLAAAGVTVVSGLAQGIDAAAHQGALDGNGCTVAVFGSGLDRVYPGWNVPLARAVRATGAWASELALGSAPLAHHFPRRNRIISGLSLGVVVVEAAEGSGSLITAGLALEQGREVFAVPGLPGAFNSRGAHGLLRLGAKLVEGAGDVLAELGACAAAPAPPPGPATPVPEGLEGLADALEDAPLHIDEVAARAGCSAAAASAGLMELVLTGHAEETPGKLYARTRNRCGGEGR